MKGVVRAAVVAALAIGINACGGSSGSAPSSGSGGSSGSSPTPSATAISGCPRTSSYTSPPHTLPTKPVTLTTAKPPWVSPLLTQPQSTADYVTAAGLPCSEEMLQVHYHAHLDINVDGTAVVVPQYLGFVVQGNQIAGLAPLHTHDNTGIIHIENSVPATFYLGQLFIEWGVKFTPTCLGPYCAGHGKALAVFVDGSRYTGDPTKLVFKAHQEIAIEYGDTGKLPKPSASYAFPAGL
jgi:hypothetical protein